MTRIDSTWTSWRFASRLARREVRRRPGRTALVIALIAFPMAAMSAASVLARTADGDETRWRHGTDLVVNDYGEAATEVPLPEGASALVFAQVGWAPIQTSNGLMLSSVDILGGDGTAMAAHPANTSGDDTTPRKGEVWLSTTLAADLGVETGDVLSLEYPDGTWTVAGVGDYSDGWGERILAFGELPVEQFTAEVVNRWNLIDLGADPDAISPDAAALDLETALRSSNPSWSGWIETAAADGIDRNHLAWGWVAGAIATAAMGIVIAAAFATSARRQITTLGTLAANGAPESIRARTLSLQGFWTGVVGSTVGICAGLVGLVAGRSLIERVVPDVAFGYKIAITDLAAIAATGIAVATVAAAIPARSTSRIPVLTALAGRRPLSAVPRRLVPIGVAVFVGGLFLLVVAASSTGGGDAITAAAVLGGLAVLAGAACASPLAVEAMSNASASAGGTWRFAGRSLARTRSRSAAVVTAVAVTGAVACAGSALAMTVDKPTYAREVPRNAVVLTPWEGEGATADDGGDDPILDLGPAPERPVDDALRNAINHAQPDAVWHDLRMVTWDDPPTPESQLYANGSTMLTPPEPVAIADAHVLDLLELGPEDRKTLETTGALITAYWVSGVGVDTEPLDFSIRTVDGDVTVKAAPRRDLHIINSPDAPQELVRGLFSLIITERAALDAGLDIVTRGAIVRTVSDLTASERNQIHDIVWGEVDLSNFYTAADSLGTGQEGWYASMEYTSWSPPTWMVQAAIIAAALVLTLLVVAIALALAATESRDERDVLVAVGARPRTIRSMAGAKAIVLSLTGVALAIPTGLLPVAAVLRTRDEAFHTPWLSLAGLLLVVPAVAGAASWTVSSLAQRLRPVQMSSLSID